MSKNTFIVNYENPELRIAELRSGKLHDLDIERLSGDLGSIFWGSVVNVLSGMEAAFIDIGQQRNGLLHFKDIHWFPYQIGQLQPDFNSKKIQLGQALMVQIARPGVGNKGPRLTTRISLPGRFIVLVFPSDTVGVSRKIESESERNRLRLLSERVRPLDCGIIVRTEAEGVTAEELEHDLHKLLKQLENLKQHAKNAERPVCLHKDVGILGKLVRDRLTHETEKIYVDDENQFQACCSLVKNFTPELLSRVISFTDHRPIFEVFNIQKDYQKVFQETVNLPHGGSLIIEETEALTVIDVNTSRFIGKDRVSETILQTNLEAVEEAALQLRLRNIGGVIVIDFIDMDKTNDRVQMLNALETALKKDRVKTHIVQLSPSGIVEITRRREGLTLLKSLYEPCFTCHGSGRLKSAETVAIEIRRRLRSVVKTAGQAISVLTHPSVAVALLGNQNELIQELEKSTSGTFVIRVDETMHRESMHIETNALEFVAEENVKERCTISIHDLLYPIEAPEYAVWKNYLVKLPDAIPLTDGVPHTSEIVVLEVIHVGRWFASARIVRGTS